MAECRHLGRCCSETVTAESGTSRSFILCEKSKGEPVAILAHIWKTILIVRLCVWTMCLNWANSLIKLLYASFFPTVDHNHCSESSIRPSITFCATLSSLSIKPLIFCETGFVLLWIKTCHWICVTIFLVRLSKKVVVWFWLASDKRLRTTAIKGWARGEALLKVAHMLLLSGAH